jgi:hypothetical protein
MFFIECVNNGFTKSIDWLAISLLFILFGACFSFPVLAYAYFIFYLLRKSSMPTLWVIILFNLASIVGVYATFYLIEGSMSSELQIIYSCSVAISSVIHLFIGSFSNKNKRVL